MTVENHPVDQDGLVETFGRFVGVFYTENGTVGSRDLDWMYHAMNIPVGLFLRYGLASNVAKSRTTTCHSGALRVGISEKAMDLTCTGVGDSGAK